MFSPEVKGPDSLRCPKCQSRIPLVATAYGFRANCEACGIRWTHIRGEEGFKPERHQAMRNYYVPDESPELTSPDDGEERSSNRE